MTTDYSFYDFITGLKYLYEGNKITLDDLTDRNYQYIIAFMQIENEFRAKQEKEAQLKNSNKRF